MSGAAAAALAPQNLEMRVIHLNLADIEDLIRKFEKKYATSTVEMLSNPAVRTAISEDDLLEWEAYVHQRGSLREYYEQVHREYLQNRGTQRHRKAADEDPTEYAA